MIVVKMGDLVKDSVSGFKGIAVSEHKYLNGCTRITVQPEVDKEGKLPDSNTFDEPQLLVLKLEKVKEGRHETGGPSKYEDEGR